MNIIINADDFGNSETGNLATLKLFKCGIVSSASIIANSKFFDMAVDISKDNPRLGIGVHLCLDGPHNIGNNYKSILNNTTHQFYDKNQITHKLKWLLTYESEIYKEYCLQIEKVLDERINISHIDHHHHLHLYIPALKAMIRVAKKFKIGYIRSQRIVLHTNNNYANRIYRDIHQLFLKNRHNTIDGFFEPHIEDGSNIDICFNRLSDLLKMEGRTIEIILHPHEENDPETSFFTSNRTGQLLANATILNYSDLR